MPINTTFQPNIVAVIPQPTEIAVTSAAQMETPPNSTFQVLDSVQLEEETTLKTKMQGEAAIRFNKKQRKELVQNFIYLIAYVALAGAGAVLIATFPPILPASICNLVCGTFSAIITTKEISFLKSQSYLKKTEENRDLLSNPENVFDFINDDAINKKGKSIFKIYSIQNQGIISENFAKKLQDLTYKLRSFHANTDKNSNPEDSIATIYNTWLETYNENHFNYDAPQLIIRK